MMTKKERAEMDEKMEKAYILAALRWSDDVRPNLPPPKHFEELTTGWLPAHWCGAVVACSSRIHHGIGRIDRITSQGARALYSTKLLALRARRYEIALESAKKLAEIDKLIEAELAAASPASSK